MKLLKIKGLITNKRCSRKNLRLLKETKNNQPILIIYKTTAKRAKHKSLSLSTAPIEDPTPRRGQTHIGIEAQLLAKYIFIAKFLVV